MDTGRETVGGLYGGTPFRARVVPSDQPNKVTITASWGNATFEGVATKKKLNIDANDVELATQLR